MDAELEYQTFIVERCSAVINSCETQDQLDIATRYCGLFQNVYYGYDIIWPAIWSEYVKKQKILTSKQYVV